MIEDAIRLFSVDGIADPHPLYAELREEAPVLELPRLGLWVLSRFEDVQSALKAPDVFSSHQPPDMRRPVRDPRLREEMKEVFPQSLVNTDPPDHTRLRKLVSGVFSPRGTARLEGRIRAITALLVDDILRKEQLDLMEDLAVPLPVTVISEVLGVDTARRADFKRWSDDLLTWSGHGPEMLESEVDRLIRSRRDFRDHLRGMIEARRAAPRDDLVSDLVRAEEAHDMLSEGEVLSMTTLLMIAGNETTTHLIGNGTLELLDHPEALRRLRADPSLIPGFIEETLRHTPPVKMISRRTARDVTVRGVTIPEGSSVFLLLDSANRDPAQFSDPDRFDITRQPQAQITFGHGIHFCVGAPLARLEGKVAFEEMLRRLPSFSRRGGPLDWQPTFALHGLRTLQLVLGARHCEAGGGSNVASDVRHDGPHIAPFGS